MKLPRQSKLQRDILDLLEDEGPIKTQKKIAEELDISQSSVSRSIQKLIDEGWVKKSNKGYEVVDRGSSISLPVSSEFREQLASIAETNKFYVEALKPIAKQRSELLQNVRDMVQAVDMSSEIQQMSQIGSELLDTQMRILNSPAMEQMIKQNQQLFDQLVPQLEPYIAQWQEQVKSMTAAIPEIIPNIPEIGQVLDEDWSDEIKKANKKLIPYGWVFTPSMSINLPEVVNDLEDDKAIEDIIDELVENRFTEEECRSILDDVLDHPLFEKRASALEEAFQSHKEGRYYVSVPTFLAQMEGAYMDAFNGDYNKEKLFEREKDHINLPGKSPFRDAMVDGLNTLLMEHLAEHTQDVEGVTLNRHLVMHGIWPEYGTKENSVKCILLLDFVKFVIEEKEELEEEKENVFCN